MSGSTEKMVDPFWSTKENPLAIFGGQYVEKLTGLKKLYVLDPKSGVNSEFILGSTKRRHTSNLTGTI